MIPQTSSDPRPNRIIPRNAATSSGVIHPSDYKKILQHCVFRRFLATTLRLVGCRISPVWKTLLCGKPSRPHSTLCNFTHYFARAPFNRGILFIAEIACETRNAPLSIFIAARNAGQWIMSAARPKASANNTRMLMVIIIIKLDKDFYAAWERAIKMLETTLRKFFRPLLYNFDTSPLIQ